MICQDSDTSTQCLDTYGWRRCENSKEEDLRVNWPNATMELARNWREITEWHPSDTYDWNLPTYDPTGDPYYMTPNDDNLE